MFVRFTEADAPTDMMEQNSARLTKSNLYWVGPHNMMLTGALPRFAYGVAFLG